MTATNEESDYFEHGDHTRPCSLIRSILSNDIDTLRKILLCKRRRNPAPLSVDNRGWTALHVAAFEDEHHDCLKLLLRNKDILLLDLDAKTHEGETALYLACERGCIKNCALLLESNCNPGLPTLELSTPLHIASENGHVAIVSQLIACDLNLNCQDEQGSTPLHLASLNGHLEVVQVLMTNKQINVSIFNTYGNLPLHLACTSDATEIIKILLEADHSLIDWPNQDGVPPLIIAMRSRFVKSVKCLLDHGANTHQCFDNIHHETILQYAAWIGDEQILELVLKATSLKYICEQIILRIHSVLSGSGSTKFQSRFSFCHSLMSCVIESDSPECMLVLLQSGLPKSILEAPYLEVKDNACLVFTPLAFLFSNPTPIGSDSLNKFLQYLLQYSITDLNEFNQMTEFESHTSCRHVCYKNPIPIMFHKLQFFDKLDHYLKILIENGISPDYGYYFDKTFQNFKKHDLQRFYEPVIEAMNEDNQEIVELFIVNSSILEPSHLWDYLHDEGWILHEDHLKVTKYLKDLIVVFNAGNIVLNLHGVILQEVPTLQELCRFTIRKNLRDKTLEDNIKNFKKKIDSLPLPRLLKNYLRFRKR